ncbi:hypothetical protein BG28_14370 [Nesterenkonia sp. AN1]|uniref:Uncharacterized protein n=1 Tax=Nesterenkonia aurantiaca TaxID=1436010 RepID=A0A4R7G2Y7_9MICC|nr:hypothetical protein [Nesterenkonia]EXF25230.1 hypothetical protein BG28_14370 [Nesterenkonia sp. AN1]TDS85724.1 hypothetical protein EV640_10565 [Nesterenkonia aurantiaca]
MSATLTERYVSAATRHVPTKERADAREKLETSIAGSVATRISRGEDPAAAERAALIDLGDPAVLAAGYARTTLHLIGPRYYLTWRRLLSTLLSFVPILAAGGVALGQTIEGAAVGEILGSSISVGFSVVLHLCFWVTLVFFILERAGVEIDAGWNPEELPAVGAEGSRSELIGSLVVLGLAGGAVLWDRLRGFAQVDGEPVPILNTGLWPWLLALLGLHAVFSLALYRRGRWDTRLAVINTVLALVFVSLILTLLARDALVSAEFLESGVLEAETLRILGILLGFAVVGLWGWSILEGWLKSRRDPG